MPVTVMAAGRAQRLREAELTYGEVGQTARRPPSGYHHLRRSAVIGSGTQLFTRAADALLSWQAHLRAGLSVTASSPTAEPGSVVLLRVWATAPADQGTVPGRVRHQRTGPPGIRLRHAAGPS
jgi:uncharacterized protein (UPF0548 family)